MKNVKPKCCKSKTANADLAAAADYLKIIAEANRLKIMCLLRGGEKCVCEIWQYLELPQNLISHHLKVLKDFGLVEDRRDGLNIYYSINSANAKKYNSLLNKFLSLLD